MALADGQPAGGIALDDLRAWDRIQEIYFSALPLAPAERKDVVAQACGFDQSLTQEVCELLSVSDTLSGFLDAPIFDLGIRVFNDQISESSELSDSAEKLIGSTIDGRYLVESRLAEGGIGCVYIARDLRLHERRVVVKVLLEKSLRNERILRKFDQEKEALARLDHPGIVYVVDSGELPDKKPYFVMQYVSGSSLREIISTRSEGIEFDRAASIIRDIGVALNAVHEKGIYHRDLKPENIMVQRVSSTEEHVKVLDFGIAKVKESLIAPSTLPGAGAIGTFAYMSPEQLHGDEVAAATDIYSFAVIAYEMLTGRRPFVADTAAGLAEMQREGVRVKPVDLRPRLTEEAQAIVLKGLAFEPRARTLGAGEFGDRLARALTTGGGFSPARRSSVRRWPLVAVVLVLIMGSAAGLYWLRRKGVLDGPANSRTTPLPHRALNYSLTVQKMRDGKPYKEAFESSGQEIFENGYRFRLNISSRQAGYLYVFNEGPQESDESNFTIIYPTPETNAGSARLEQNQNMQTNWNTFGGKSGVEKFWIVWSAEVVTPLEIARHEAFKNKDGAITDPATVSSVREFLTGHSIPAPEITKETAKQRTSLRVDGDLLVKLVELEHR